MSFSDFKNLLLMEGIQDQEKFRIEEESNRQDDLEARNRFLEQKLDRIISTANLKIQNANEIIQAYAKNELIFKEMLSKSNESSDQNVSEINNLMNQIEAQKKIIDEQSNSIAHKNRVIAGLKAQQNISSKKDSILEELFIKDSEMKTILKALTDLKKKEGAEVISLLKEKGLLEDLKNKLIKIYTLDEIRSNLQIFNIFLNNDRDLEELLLLNMIESMD